MSKIVLTVSLATFLMFGIFVEVTPALARRGADDSLEKLDDHGRGRGRDDFLEDHHSQEGSRGKNHLQGENHRRSRGFDRGRNLKLQDDSTGRDGGCGRDDR